MNEQGFFAKTRKRRAHGELAFFQKSAIRHRENEPCVGSFFAGRTNYHIYLTMVINALNMVA